MLAVPFTIGGSFESDAPATSGRVAYGGVSVMLEFDVMREHDADRTTRKILIGIEEFATCRYKRGLRHDRIVLRTVSLAALGGVPGAVDDTVVLHIAKCDRDLAEALVERLTAAVSESGMRRSSARLAVPTI